MGMHAKCDAAAISLEAAREEEKEDQLTSSENFQADANKEETMSAAINEELENEEHAEDEEIMPETNSGIKIQFPTLEEYRSKWQEQKQFHMRSQSDVFSRMNLVPEPLAEYWQNVPHVPFHELRSKEALARLSLCRPVDEISEAGVSGGTAKYAHNVGGVSFRRRGPWQIAETHGFIVNREGKQGSHIHIELKELQALHECLNWLRDGNNKLIASFYHQYEKFTSACSIFSGRLRHALPEASAKLRIWFTPKRTRASKEGSLDETLQQHDIGLVIVDGHPISYHGTQALQQMSGEENYHIGSVFHIGQGSGRCGAAGMIF